MSEYTAQRGPNVHEGIEHIIWTIERAPAVYELFRDRLIDLRIAIVNAELRYQEQLREQGNG